MRRGNPPRAEAVSRPFRVRLSPAERDILRRAAAINRQDQSAFARDALMTAASECLEGVSPPIERGRTRMLTPKGVGR